MTDAELAVAVTRARGIEMAARAAADSAAAEHDATNYPAALTARRQAGALRQALEKWIVARATGHVHDTP
jgi:hypothetical protein